MGLGFLTSLKICRPEYVLTHPENVTLFHSKLLLDNSASFTSLRNKKLVSKLEGKSIFFEAPTFNNPGS